MCCLAVAFCRFCRRLAPEDEGKFLQALWLPEAHPSCKGADATLISFTDVKAEMEKTSLGSRVEKSDVTSLRMPRCPRLAKEACVCTSPKTLRVEGVGFQLCLRNVCL